MKPSEAFWEDSAAVVESGILLTKSFLLAASTPPSGVASLCRLGSAEAGCAPFGRVLRIDDLHSSRRGYSGVGRHAPERADRAGLLGVLFEQEGERSQAVIDIHADSRANHGNLYFETIRDLDRGIPGWLWTSNADILSYTFPKREVLVLLPLRTLRAWFEQSVHRFRRHETLHIDERGQRKSVGSLVPTNLLLASVPGAHIRRREGFRWHSVDLPDRAPLRAVG